MGHAISIFGGLGGGADSLGIKFNSLPVVEAEADEDSFVVEFNSPTAGSNETGTGAGRSGPDLVFTQGGGVPASDGLGRLITSQTSQYFQCTPDLVNHFASNAGGMSVIYQCSDLTVPGLVNYLRLTGMTCQWYSEALYSGYFQHAPTGGRGTKCNAGVSSPALPVPDIFWHAWSIDYTTGLGFAGIAISPTLPTKIKQFLGVGTFFNASYDYTPTLTWDPNYRAIVGTTYAGNPTALFKIRSITLSKTPYAILA